MKKINVKVQILATLFLPSGLWAFKRIGKLKVGILIYGLTYLEWILQTLLISPIEQTALFGISSLASLCLNVILPMIAIDHYTRQYNTKILV